MNRYHEEFFETFRGGEGWGGKDGAHGKNDHDILLVFHHHGQVIAHLESPERFVDEHVADLRRGDEPRRRGQQIARAQGAGLQPERAQREQGFFCFVRDKMR